MTMKEFCRTLYSCGWSRYRDDDTVYVSRGRTGFVLEKDWYGNWYFGGTDVELSEVESIYFRRDRIILYFYNGCTNSVWF